MITNELLKEWSKPRKCSECRTPVIDWSHSGIDCRNCGSWLCINCTNENTGRCDICGSAELIDRSKIIY